jgi:hypothetical protein
MIYHPQQYVVPDVRMQLFIDSAEIWGFVHNADTSK